MKVFMVTGSVPPSMCGVGDYSVKLVEALQGEGVDSEIVTSNDWGPRGGYALATAIGKREPGIVHMQYPTNGYGHRLGPHVLSMFKRSVITLHEFSNVHVLRKVAELPFAIVAKHLVFTDAYEREEMARFWPLIRPKASVIPIGSNIDSSSATPKHGNREVLHFGALYPNKGLEAVIELSREIKKRSLPFKVRIAGLLRPDYQGYASELIARSEGLPLEWSLNQSDEQIIGHLSSAFIAYLPFPDGASDRRGSLKAVLQGGLPCVTTIGEHTAKDLSEVLLFADNPDSACDILLELSASHNMWMSLSGRARVYAQRYAWSGIARLHRRLYEALQ